MGLRVLVIDEAAVNSHAAMALTRIELSQSGNGTTESIPYLDGIVVEATTIQNQNLSGLRFQFQGRDGTFFIPEYMGRIDNGEHIRAYVPVEPLPNTPVQVVAFQIINEGAEVYSWTTTPFAFCNGKNER
ncbi:hypothetical protein HYS47_02175 [Candidatus Woesearchaeota archaeon]|nr:hypothetical protein [Candidatus Woesearchaeota archaeon]